jgi:starvation-inducible outer membrane lipoprotein
MKCNAAFVVILCLLLAGCATTQQRLLDSDSSQLQLRSIQTRAFDTTDKDKTLRTIMATLQDLEFVIDKADATLGTVSATKLKHYSLRMTVTVRPRGETQLLVRANAQYNIQPVTDPELYQQFFISLEKAMFLTAHQAD